jgi:histidinol-phosphatase (PHP family)
MIDYHVHTSLCNHANGTMEQYVRRAVNIGLAEICFLDHLTLHEKGKNKSMSPEELPFYFHAARYLAAKYKDRILVKAGLEVDIIPEYIDQIKKIITPFAFDVIAGSVHFIEDINIVSTKGNDPRRDQLSIDYICEKYLENLDVMLDSDMIDMICHLDVVKKFGRRPPAQFDEKFDEILSKISYKKIAVELNTSGYNHAASEFYPATPLLAKCFEKKINITLGSDAHHPDSVGQHYVEALNLLIATGFRHVVAFNRRNRYEIQLLPKAGAAVHRVLPEVNSEN